MIDAFDGKSKRPRQVALFPCDRQPPERLPETVLPVHVDLSRMELRRPRQWGACWLAIKLWEMPDLDAFFTPRLPPSRKGTRWDLFLKLLVCARLIKPSSEWNLHREGYRQSAMADLLGMDPGIVPKNPLYHCHDKLLEHKDGLFRHLSKRWQDLFGARHEVLLYDLTSTYFECAPPADTSGRPALDWRYELLPQRGTSARFEIKSTATGEDRKLWYPVHAFQHTRLREFASPRQFPRLQSVVHSTHNTPIERMIGQENFTPLTNSSAISTPKDSEP